MEILEGLGEAGARGGARFASTPLNSTTSMVLPLGSTTRFTNWVWFSWSSISIILTTPIGTRFPNLNATRLRRPWY